MATKQEVTQQLVREIVHYDPESGVFTWLKKYSPKSTRIHVGQQAGGLGRDGYIRINIAGVTVGAHRLAFLYMDGYLPEQSVDHVNRNRADNRWANLREATQQCQMRNKSMMRNNSSGITGIYWCKVKRKWRVEIGEQRSRFVGLFSDLLDAAYARFAAEQCLGFRDCDKDSSAKRYIDEHS